MFLLRCGFWLSIVYAAVVFGLPWQATPRGGALADAARAEAAALDAGRVGRAIAERAATGIGRSCAERGLACARDAADLTALVEAALVGGGIGEPPEAAPPHAEGDRIAAPMPVPDPRRRGRATQP